MANLKSTQAIIFLLLYLGTLLISQACPNCPYSTPYSKSPNLPPKYPSKVKSPVAKPPPTILKPPPHVPKPPTGKPPHISKLTLFFSWGYHYAYPHGPPTTHPPRLPRRPFVHPPPIRPELFIFTTVPITPKPPIVYRPTIPTPPITPPPLPSIVPQPPPETPSPPPSAQENPCSPPPSPPKTCPILKLDACVNELGSLVHIGIGSKAKDTCCPVLAGLWDLDAALCLCTTIKAKRLNINIIIPIAVQVLVDCGKTPLSSFQCPA